jgi:50S ribosomal subunit-associated GTPase HflX
MVVANKIDEAVAAVNLKKFKRRIPRTHVLPISAAFDEGVDRFKQLMREAVEKAGIR